MNRGLNCQTAAPTTTKAAMSHRTHALDLGARLFIFLRFPGRTCEPAVWLCSPALLEVPALDPCCVLTAGL